VLSSTTVSIDWVFSRCSPPLNKTPISAALPEPAMMEVGVAKPSAHGQAITRIEIVGISAAPKSPGVTAKYQIKKVTSATPTTIGTNTLEILSEIGRASCRERV